jgi:hypothetical protein
MGFLNDLVSAPGIFGPPILLAGAAAGAMCGWATLRPNRRAARRAVWWAISPAAIGLMAVALGSVRWALFYGPAASPWSQWWPALGYTALFGVLVSAVPLAWAVALVRRAPTPPAGPTAADYDDRPPAGPGGAPGRPA